MNDTDREIIDALVMRVARLEQQMALVLQRFGGESQLVIADAVDGVEQLVAKGDLIGAIKLHREKTLVGLAEAKRHVDELAARRRP